MLFAPLAPISESVMDQKNEVTDKMLEQAYIIMAKIIRDHGEKYLPIFKRIHEERETRKANQDLVKIALQVAKDV